MADRDRQYFRNKQIVQRQKFHQKILRPLAAWIENQHPKEIIIRAIPVAAGWLFLRLFVTYFYGWAVALPWIIMALALTLAGLSHVLRKGDARD